MSFENLNEFSLWLEPTSEELERIQNIISNFSKKAHVENFVPHVTLLGGIPYDKSIINEHLTKILENTPEFKIKFSTLSFGDNPLKCFFLECEQDKILFELNKKAQEIISINKEFKPHMSLLYGNMSEKEKNILASEVEKFGLEYFSFTPKKISVWHAHGSPKNWKKVTEITLNIVLKNAPLLCGRGGWYAGA